jgi:hypothetical protein
VVVKALSDVLVEGALVLLGDRVLVLGVVPWLGVVVSEANDAEGLP